MALDRALKACLECGVSQLQAYDIPGLQSLQAKREEVLQQMQQVTSRVYPSQSALPLDHIALRNLASERQ